MNQVETLYSFNAEAAVIGSCLEDNDVINSVSFLNSDDFYNKVTRQLYGSIVEMNDNGLSIDMISLCEFIGDDSLYTTITKTVEGQSTRMVVAYADIVRDYSNKRKAIAFMQESISKIQNDGQSSIDAMSELGDFANSIAASSNCGNVITIEQLINKTLDEMEESNSGVKVGISTGIPEVDERLGYKKAAFGEITALGGLSKNGKTLTANTILARAELESDEVGHVFSIEMTCEGMFNAVISAKTGVPANFYCRQDYYAKNYASAYETMHARWGAAATDLNESQKLTFDDKKQVDADYICANMRKVAAKSRAKGKKLRLVVIDHLHRMEFKTGDGPLTYAIRDAARKIKNTASELGVAVILLVQLNNRAEDQDPTSFHILDSSSVRHEMQAFIGVRMFRDKGSVYFGIFGDSQRFGDHETQHTPAYMKLINGVLRSLPSDEQYWKPKKEEE